MSAVRIIAGRHKNRRIPVRHAPGLRPSPERVRETLYNWLQWEIQGLRVLDAFAGSGALGLEALSRGAAEVTFLDVDRANLRAIEALCRTWQVDNARFYVQDALQHRGAYDLILLDPPFAAELLPAALAHFVPQLAPGTYVYMESASPPAERSDLQLKRTARAGAVYFSLWMRP